MTAGEHLTMPASQQFDVSIENGLFFDGRGGEPLLRHLGVRDGRVVAVSEAPFPEGCAARRIDAVNGNVSAFYAMGWG